MAELRSRAHGEPWDLERRVELDRGRARPKKVPFRLRKVREHFVEGNRVTLLRNGAEAFPAMLGAIESAEQEVLLEMYWFESDTIGWRFVEALSGAAGRGVRVAVLYDSLGSWATDAELFASLVGAGVKLREFNPLAPWKKRFRFDRLSRRSHRKILVVDSVVGFTGGLNIADAWLPPEQGGQGWRDDMVKVEGAVVGELVECFVAAWRSQGGETLRRERRARPTAIVGEQRVRVLGQYPARNRREIADAYLWHIYRARRRVWIASSYFLPDRSVVRALVRAARRGVDVRIIVPGVSDVEIVRLASRAMWGRLMRAGVRLYEWHLSTLHSKTAVIDSRWSTVGTFNLDYRSLFMNWEVNVAVLDRGFAGAVEASFRRDVELANEVDYDDFHFRPLGERIIERIGYWLRRFL
jgi:cardiolipin synthase